jgi:hypothetical protein
VKTKAPVSYRTVFPLIFLLVSLTSCIIPTRDVYETSVIRVDEKDVKTRLAWLIDGKTTKEEVIRSENFRDVNPRILSQGKILVYCINWDEQKAQYVGSTTCFHQLVLVFDEKDILKRFSILMMNYG